MAQQNQLAKPVLPELSPQHQQFLSQLVDTVNSIQGFNGPISLHDHVLLNGNQLKDVGAPTAPTDAITHGIAEESYSARVLAPKLEATGSQPLKSVRRINDPNQREQVSSYLNDLMSTPPSANGIIPLTTSALTSGVVTSAYLGAGGTSGYHNASNLPTTSSGSGTGAKATITTAGGIVTGGSVTGGVDYAIGDKVYPTQAGSSADAYFLVSGITNSGNVTVTIPATPFTFADGSTIYLHGRTDTLSLPASYGIQSISSVGNLVTVVTYLPTGLLAGKSMTIVGVTPSGFNGSYVVNSATPPYTFTYQNDLGTVSGSGGSVELGNVYYYAVKKRSPIISLIGPVSGDTAQNRLQANLDGVQIVAVVVLTNSGTMVSSSGGGGSPILGSPAAGCFF